MNEYIPVAILKDNGFIEGFNGYTKGKWWPAPGEKQI